MFVICVTALPSPFIVKHSWRYGTRFAKNTIVSLSGPPQRGSMLKVPGGGPVGRMTALPLPSAALITRISVGGTPGAFGSRMRQ